MISPYLQKRYLTSIDNDVLYLARVQMQDFHTRQWRTVRWVSCKKTLPVGHPDRWSTFLEE